MVFVEMLQTKTANNASRAMRIDFIKPKFLFKSNTMQPCLSNYTIPINCYFGFCSAPLYTEVKVPIYQLCVWKTVVAMEMKLPF